MNDFVMFCWCGILCLSFNRVIKSDIWVINMNNRCDVDLVCFDKVRVKFVLIL